MDLHKLFTSIFAPQPGETALVLVDLPHGKIFDNGAWQRRREMAVRWHTALTAFGEHHGFTVLPLTSYPATGSHGAELPAYGYQEHEQVTLTALAAQATLLIAMTQFSASAPLTSWTQRFPQLRVASMPLAAPEMETTALAADYERMARSCERLSERLRQAAYVRIGFSNGDLFTLDLRFREPQIDDGTLRGDAQARLINLPGGEAYTAVYEGERANEPSATAGVLPVEWRGEIIRLEIERNRVVDVLGRGEAADDLRIFLSLDSARRNVAELGLGCNPMARVWGNVLEDEKAGPHIGLGRSEHLGGVTGPDSFADPRHIWHQDFVYARGCPIHIAQMISIDAQRNQSTLVVNGHYVEELGVGI